VVVPFPPHALHLCLPDLPVPKHCAHQETRSSEPHLGHELLTIATLLIAAAPCLSKNLYYRSGNPKHVS
jgi:hypothetical protein